MALVPLLLAGVTLGAVWWYVTIHSQPDAPAPWRPPRRPQTPAPSGGLKEPPGAATGLQEPPTSSTDLKEPPTSGGLKAPGAGGLQEPPGSSDTARSTAPAGEGLQELGGPPRRNTSRRFRTRSTPASS
jgi:hypothetical protein